MNTHRISRTVLVMLLGFLSLSIIGFFLVSIAYFQFFGLDGIQRSFNEFLSQPDIAFSVLLFGETEGNPAWEKAHEWLWNPLLQTGFWLFIVFNLVSIWWGRSGLKQADGYGSHGTARFQTKREIKKNYQQDNRGFILGEANRHIAIHSVKNALNLNSHALCFGGSGSAKTAGYMIPNILHIAERLGESQVILDPKGELWNQTSQYLKSLGYKVIPFNLLDPEKKRSARWNPLRGLKQTHEVVELANMIYESTSSEREDKFFANSGKDLLISLMLYILESRPEKEHHLKNVVHLCSTIGKDQETLRGMFDSLPEGSQARSFFDNADCEAEKQWEGIRGDVKSRLGLWILQEIGELTAESDFDLSDLGREKTVLYLMIPDSDTTYNLLPSLIVSQAFKTLIEQADANDGGRLEKPVWFLLDELGNLPRIKDLDAKVNTVRSRGIRIMMIFQNIPQFEKKYGKDGSKSIDASCDTTIFLGTKEQTTNKLFSDMLGTTTIQIQSTSENKGKNDSMGTSHSYTSRSLMTPDEVKMIRDTNEVLIFQPGRYPARMKKCLYFQKEKWKDIPKTEWTKIPKRKYEPLALCEMKEEVEV